MAGSKIEQKALDLLNAFERAGKSVERVTKEGRKIELVLIWPKEGDKFDPFIWVLISFVGSPILAILLLIALGDAE